MDAKYRHSLLTPTAAVTLLTFLFAATRSTTFCTYACFSSVETVVGSFFIGDDQYSV